MFDYLHGRLVARDLPGRNAILTGMRPSHLSQYLELTWGSPRTPFKQEGLRGDFRRQIHMSRLQLPDPQNGHGQRYRMWHHLIYAFLLENTRMVDIFRRVVFEWVHGEKLPPPSPWTQQWIQTTERVFFTDPAPDGYFAITSSIRPDRQAVRRNAYWRMFGWDLQHGSDSGGRYPYVQGIGSNNEFGVVFELLLVHVWRAYANRNNQFGQRETDDFAMEDLVRKLREMLTTRRAFGTLAREEFDAVALCDWLLFGIREDTQLVCDLNATAEGAGDRLKRIGEKVGIAAHARTDSFIEMAFAASVVLMAIESDSIPDVTELYTDNGAYTEDMLRIINHWTLVTGRNVKDPTLHPPVSNIPLHAPRAAAYASVAQLQTALTA
jgi:hypothetical protein